MAPVLSTATLSVSMSIPQSARRAGRRVGSGKGEYNVLLFIHGAARRRQECYCDFDLPQPAPAMETFTSFSWLFLLLSSLLLSIEAEAFPPMLRTSKASATPWKEQPLGEALIQDADYNDGAYGRYVTQTFKSANVTVPRLNMDKSFTECDDGSYLFVTPRGEIVKRPLAAIYDAT